MLLRSAIAAKSGSLRVGTMRTVNARAPGAPGSYATNLRAGVGCADRDGSGDGSGVGAGSGTCQLPYERVTFARTAAGSTSPVIAIHACSGRGRIPLKR